MQVATEEVAATTVAVVEEVAGEGEFFGHFLFLSSAPP